MEMKLIAKDGVVLVGLNTFSVEWNISASQYLVDESGGTIDNAPEINEFLRDYNELGYPKISLMRQSVRSKYPAYFKDVEQLAEIDVYQVHELFQVQDLSGCLHHASKKILLCGQRTGGKDRTKEIKEARDTLTRWLQIQGAE